MTRILFFLNYFIFIICICCFTQCIWSDNLSNTSLQRIEIKQQKNQTTLLLTLKNHTTPSIFILPHPDRLVIDLPKVQASNALPREIHSNGLIKHIRLGSGPEGIGNLRAVIDLAGSIEYTYLNDDDTKKNTQILTILLTQKKPSPPETQENDFAINEEEPTSIEALENPSNLSMPEEKITQTLKPLTRGQSHLITSAHKNYALINHTSLNKIIVMIDPGHGGKDSGAIGPQHIMEKNIVLAISKKLQGILNNMPGMDARLTRQGDYFISLRNRLNIARHNHAQMFIAVHADACLGNTAHGASVFALSAHGASSENARWLADRENTSELCGIDLKNKNHELKSILLDMSQTATIQESVLLGDDILSALMPFSALHVSHVEQAGFVVLKSPDIPSVLIETGFISTPEEEHLLTDADYQNKLAQAIAAGIRRYFAQNPPPDSWFEMQYKK